MTATTTRTDAEALAVVEDVPPLRYPPTHKLRQAIAAQAVGGDPSVWDEQVTLGRQMLAARLRDSVPGDVLMATVDACTRAIRAEHGQEEGR